jgi:hypothetical protein
VTASFVWGRIDSRVDWSLLFFFFSEARITATPQAEVERSLVTLHLARPAVTPIRLHAHTAHTHRLHHSTTPSLLTSYSKNLPRSRSIRGSIRSQTKEAVRRPSKAPTMTSERW